jgi:hypothetical protein
VIKYTNACVIWIVYNSDMNPGETFGMATELSLAERRKAVSSVYESVPLVNILQRVVPLLCNDREKDNALLGNGR